MTALPFLNLGSGRTKFPGERPSHHQLVPNAIYDYPAWMNISRNASENPDCVMDLFAYPWALESNAYEGALAAHFLEHLPHEIKISIPKDELKKYVGSSKGSIDKHFARYTELAAMQDAWFCWWSELHRVLVNGALVYALVPHAWSTGAMSDPTHTRYLLPESFSHSMRPDPNAPFEYSTGGLHFEIENVVYGLSPYFAHLAPQEADSPESRAKKTALLEEAANTRMNVISEFCVTLRCVK